MMSMVRRRWNRVARSAAEPDAEPQPLTPLSIAGDDAAEPAIEILPEILSAAAAASRGRQQCQCVFCGLA